jgi:hypothetical protein
MSLKTTARLAAAAVAFVSSAASAEVITFQFTGTVTYSPYMAVPGTRITGTFAYDTDTEPVINRHRQGQTSAYGYYEIPAPFQISAQVGGHTIVSTNLLVEVWNNQRSNVEDTVDVSGNMPVVDGTTYANGFFGFRLASAPGHTNVLLNTRLPRSFDVQEFDSQHINYAVLQSDGTQAGQLLHFTLDSIQVVETPR